MKIRTPEYYKDFACVGGSCIDTCCAGWEVDVDKASSAYYKSVEGPFGDRLRKMLIDCPVEDRFALQEHKRCPFLNKDNLCDIYTELGRDKLCETCTNFPRHITEFGSTREIGISLSCPVAVELIMSRKERITFCVEENDDKVSTYNDIDAGLYIALAKARETAYAICQNRDIPVQSRAALFLDYAHELQKKIHRQDKLSEIIDRYSDEVYLKERLTKLRKKYALQKYEYSLDFLMRWFELFDRLELMHQEEWKKASFNLLFILNTDDATSKEYHEKVRDWEYQFEHLLVYYIYRYFLQGVFDNKIYEKAELGCVALIMISLLGMERLSETSELTFENQIAIMRIYSKETEHSEENLKNLYSAFSKNKYFSFSHVMKILFDEKLFCQRK